MGLRRCVTCLSLCCLSRLRSIKPFSQQSYAMQASGPAPITGGCPPPPPRSVDRGLSCRQSDESTWLVMESFAPKLWEMATMSLRFFCVCEVFYCVTLRRDVSTPLPLFAGYESTAGLSMSPGAPPWQGRSIASSKLRMLEFSAFLEQPQDPETVSRATRRHLCLISVSVVFKNKTAESYQKLTFGFKDFHIFYVLETVSNHDFMQS